MKVLKRSGAYENLSFDKVLFRIRRLSLDEKLGAPLCNIDPDVIAQKVVNQIYNGVSSSELDELAARLAIGMSTEHSEYSILASRIIISNMHKNTTEIFSRAMETLYANTNINGEKASLIRDEVMNVIRKNSSLLNSCIDYTRDYLFDYFGYKTLEKSYLLKLFNVKDNEYHIVERPQHMWLRVSLGIHPRDIEAAIQTYNYMSQKYFTHASPTLFNSATNHQQFSSCFDANTIISTVNRGPVKISEVAIGDQVVTHLGNVKPVLQMHKNLLGNRNYYEVEPYKSVKFKVTGNHQFWTLRKNELPKWKSIENMNLSEDYLCIPNKHGGLDCEILDLWSYKNVIENDQNITIHQNDEDKLIVTTKIGSPVIVNRYWKINDTFSKFIGVYYVDGDTLKNEKGIVLGIDEQNVKLVNFCVKACTQIFGWSATQCVTKKQNTVQISLQSPIVGVMFKYLFGRYLDGKKIYNGMYQWSKKLVYNLFQGIISANGWITKTYAIGSFTRDLYYLLRNNSIDCSYNWREIQREDDVLEYDDYKFLKIKSRKQITENLPEYVYTLGVQDDHSYSAEGFIAENCFLLGTEDSMKGIYKTISDSALISKFAGGIGMHVTNIRAKNSYIRGSNGKSDGLVPLLKVLNSTANYCNQGSKRKGSFAIYLEPWHADIFDFLNMKKNNGDENQRARDLFYALWIPDLFMKAVETDAEWHLFCPNECPGLSDVFGENFEKLYDQYVFEKRYRTVVKAQKLWKEILIAQIETGTPYMLYKDSCNAKSNQKNLGTIKSSNLCSEIILYSDKDEYACCNLASIGLPMYIQNNNFNHNLLHDVVKIITKNMNNVIDHNFYPVPETEVSNLKHRPIGIGVQGLYDTFMQLRIPFESKEAQVLNKEIFETIQYAALEMSMELAEKDGAYSSFQKSPISEGQFQHNLWNVQDDELSGRWDWNALKQKIMKVGVRNSVVTTAMPTASTSNIFGFTECFEVVTSNIYMRNTLSGSFPVVNKYLLKDLYELGLWNSDMKNKIIQNDGSIQNIAEIPKDLKDLYKTVWETKQKTLIDLSADRGIFIDQSQSLNIFMDNPSYSKLSSMHLYGWKKGLKTGMYYLRTKGASKAEQITVAPKTAVVCNDEVCVSCSG